MLSSGAVLQAAWASGLLLAVVTATSSTPPPMQFQSPVKLSTADIIARDGYTMEEHLVNTTDGYILRVHRLPRGLSGPAHRLAPVLIVHGMVGSSSDFVLLGPKRSLAYLLADAGYDVFLGNLRFNEYASHVSLSKNDSAYWDFSLDDHGLKDVPAMATHVLQVTRARALHYVGYSMGATAYMMMCASRPDLARRVLSFVGLAPAVHMSNLRSMATLAFSLDLPNTLLKRGVNMISFGGEYQTMMANNLCSPRFSAEDFCFSLAFFLVGDDYAQIDYEAATNVFANVQPFTVMQVIHYMQLSGTDKLLMYDHGPAKNMQLYGSLSPPAYNMTANTAPVALFYGRNDWLTPEEEVKKLADVYKSYNKLMMVKAIPWEKFNHYDFVFSKDIDKLANNNIVKILNRITHKRRKKIQIY